MQRLFSTFAGGSPGVGLLLLRLLTAAAFIYFGIDSVRAAPPLTIVVLESIYRKLSRRTEHENNIDLIVREF